MAGVKRADGRAQARAALSASPERVAVGGRIPSAQTSRCPPSDGRVYFRGPGDTSTQRLLELHDYGVETRGEVGAVRGARGRANTGGAWSGSQTEVLSRRGRLPRRRPG